MLLVHEDLLPQFNNFVKSRPRVAEGDDPDSLLDCFEDWITSSRLIEECAGDRARALVAFSLAAACYFDHPEDWPGVEGITSPGHYRNGLYRSPLLDPDMWDQAVFQRKYGRDDIESGQRRQFPDESAPTR